LAEVELALLDLLLELAQTRRRSVAPEYALHVNVLPNIVDGVFQKT
jgi:hypothetical protein